MYPYLDAATRRGLLVLRSRSRPRRPQLVPQGAAARGTAGAVPGSARHSGLSGVAWGQSPRPGAIWGSYCVPHRPAARRNWRCPTLPNNARRRGEVPGMASPSAAMLGLCPTWRAGRASHRSMKSEARLSLGHTRSWRMRPRRGGAQPHGAALCRDTQNIAPQSGGAPAPPRGTRAAGLARARRSRTQRYPAMRC